jgi:23S rRNA (adenine2503-C2)-methyltransferase
MNPISKLPAKVSEKLSVYGLSQHRLSEILSSLGFPSYRAKQIFDGIYRTRNSFPSLQNIKTLKTSERNHLEGSFSFDLAVSLVREQVSIDGTIKWLLEGTSSKQIEVVFIPADDESMRGTLCVSSQVGCSLRCTFCHTGTQKFEGNLSAGEIVSQVVFATIRLNQLERVNGITNIVFMGQGEPGFNSKNVLQAIEILSEKNSLNISPHKITVSTSGVVPFIHQLAQSPLNIRLAISLHAPSDAVREGLMNINSTYNFEALMQACAQWVESRLRLQVETLGRMVSDTHNSKHRVRLTFEYVLLKWVNDSASDAKQLADSLLKYIPDARFLHVNLIRYNSWPGSTFEGSEDEAVMKFQTVLKRRSIQSHVRKSRGSDILSACGQLKSSEKSKRSAEKVERELEPQLR